MRLIYNEQARSETNSWDVDGNKNDVVAPSRDLMARTIPEVRGSCFNATRMILICGKWF